VRRLEVDRIIFWDAFCPHIEKTRGSRKPRCGLNGQLVTAAIRYLTGAAKKC